VAAKVAAARAAAAKVAAAGEAAGEVAAAEVAAEVAKIRGSAQAIKGFRHRSARALLSRKVECFQNSDQMRTGKGLRCRDT
jgi:hypothetical protein